jgi:hypothetical protein
MTTYAAHSTKTNTFIKRWEKAHKKRWNMMTISDWFSLSESERQFIVDIGQIPDRLLFNLYSEEMEMEHDIYVL